MIPSRSAPPIHRRLCLATMLAGSALACAVQAASAQTDFYNTDRGRPVQIEDAYATERYAFEFRLAPVRLERLTGGRYQWSVEPEVAYGILPRTQVEIGLPLVFSESGGQRRSGVAGIDLSLLHNLNVETTSLPAFALRADVLAPVGDLGPVHPYGSVTAIATRTAGWGRFHVNAQYAIGPDPASAASGAGGPAAPDLGRWLAGVAVDKTFPLESMLATVEAFGRKPLRAPGDDATIEYTIGTGVRIQVSPVLAFDAGVGRRLTGGDQGWYVTFGTAYALGLASLFPGGK